MLVKQIANALDLIEHFGRTKQPMSMSEIAQAFSWPRSSTFNIVETLVERGYLFEPSRRGEFYPTTSLSALAAEIGAASPLPAGTHDVLRDLTAATGETICITGPIGVNVVMLDVSEPDTEIRYSTSVGSRLKVEVSAAGYATLAQYPHAERDALLRKIDYAPLPDTPVMDPGKVVAALDAGRARGWYEIRTLSDPGVMGLAVPLPLNGRRLALALGGPGSRVEPKLKTCGRALQDGAARLIKMAQ